MQPVESPLYGPGTLLFDLDGTLIDSLPDLLRCLNAVLTESGLRPIGAATAAGYVGDGARVLLERAFAAEGRTVPADGLERFLRLYETELVRETRPFPGVLPALEGLSVAGWTMAVCTNKPERHSCLILEALHLAPYFAAVAGGDTHPERKPDGRHLTRTLEALGADPARAVMIGDGMNDVLAARDAGLPVVVVAWGYGNPAALEGDRLVKEMEQLELEVRAALDA